jgi:glycosyltransferase involved in cell wall biosynthesis
MVFVADQPHRADWPRQQLAAAAPTVLHARVVTGTGGGPDKTILNSPRFLSPFGYRVLCAFLHPPGDPGFDALRGKARERGAPLLSIPDRGAFDWTVLRKLAGICRRERVDIWHGHDYKSNLIGIIINKLRPMHLITTVHGWVRHTGRTRLYFGIDRLCLRHYDRVLCVSAELRQRCLAFRVPAERCVEVANAIDAEEYARTLSTAQAKRKAGVPSGRLVIGAVGRLSPEKGFDLLIRSAHQLLQAGIDLELWIAGEGDEEPRLRALIAELGCGERIRLLGYRADTAALYEAMDVYVLSSLREGLPNVVLEAMAMEVPVIATHLPGVAELVHSGENGWLVQPGAGDDLTAALRALLQDTALRERLGRAGRRAVVHGQFSFSARMAKVRRIYDTLLHGDGRTAATRGTGEKEDMIPKERGLSYFSPAIGNGKCPHRGTDT